MTRSPRPSRRAVTTTALAALVAGVCGTAAPALADPTPGPLPVPVATSPTAFGESIQLLPGDTVATGLARQEALYGRLGAVRLFQNAPDPRAFTALGSRSGIISLRVPPADVLSGAYDQAFLDFFRAAPTDHPTWWSYYHEADQAWSTGELTDLAQFRAAWAHVATLARSVANAQLRSTVILTGWTVNPWSKRDFRWFVPDDRSLVDVLAFDNYNGTPQQSVGLDRAAAASIGKPFGVAEFGHVVDGDVIGRADFIRSFATTAAAAGAQFVSYWDSNGYGDDEDYRLLDAPSQLALRDVVAGTPVTAPDAPPAVTLVPGRGALVASWARPDDHGAPVTSWRVLAVDAETGEQVGTVLVTGPSSAVVSGLVDGRPYVVTVSGSNVAGSSPSTTSTPTPAGGELTAPGAPALSSVLAGNGSLAVSWGDPAGDGGSALTGWTVTAVDAATGQRTPVSVGAAARCAALTGLVNGHAYTVEVAALNAFGAGTAAVSASAVPYTAPSQVAAATVVGGDGAVTATWTAPVSDGGRAVTAYVLKAYGPGRTPLASVTVPGTATSGTISGLTNGRPVTVTVTATNGATGAESPRSAPVTPVAAPTSPVAHGFSGSRKDAVVSATAWWARPSSTGGSAITSYRVATVLDGALAPVQVQTVPAAAGQRLVVTGLVPGAHYRFVVTAVNAAGASLPSLPSSVVTAY